MTQAVFDKLLELRDGAAAAVTSTASGTGIAVNPRMLPSCSWVISVTAIVANDADETYVFTLEVSDVVGGTYTPIASFNWPRGNGAGKVHIGIQPDQAAFQDTDSAFVRVTATLGGTTPSVTYGSYLTKATTNPGKARDTGGTP